MSLESMRARLAAAEAAKAKAEAEALVVAEQEAAAAAKAEALAAVEAKAAAAELQKQEEAEAVIVKRNTLESDVTSLLKEKQADHEASLTPEKQQATTLNEFMSTLEEMIHNAEDLNETGAKDELNRKATEALQTALNEINSTAQQLAELGAPMTEDELDQTRDSEENRINTELGQEISTLTESTAASKQETSDGKIKDIKEAAESILSKEVEPIIPEGFFEDIAEMNDETLEKIKAALEENNLDAAVNIYQEIKRAEAEKMSQEQVEKRKQEAESFVALLQDKISIFVRSSETSSQLSRDTRSKKHDYKAGKDFLSQLGTLTVEDVKKLDLPNISTPDELNTYYDDSLDNVLKSIIINEQRLQRPLQKEDTNNRLNTEFSGIQKKIESGEVTLEDATKTLNDILENPTFFKDLSPEVSDDIEQNIEKIEELLAEKKREAAEKKAAELKKEILEVKRDQLKRGAQLIIRDIKEGFESAESLSRSISMDTRQKTKSLDIENAKLSAIDAAYADKLAKARKSFFRPKVKEAEVLGIIEREKQPLKEDIKLIQEGIDNNTKRINFAINGNIDDFGGKINKMREQAIIDGLSESIADDELRDVREMLEAKLQILRS